MRCIQNGIQIHNGLASALRTTLVCILQCRHGLSRTRVSGFADVFFLALLSRSCAVRLVSSGSSIFKESFPSFPSLTTHAKPRFRDTFPPVIPLCFSFSPSSLPPPSSGTNRNARILESCRTSCNFAFVFHHVQVFLLLHILALHQHRLVIIEEGFTNDCPFGQLNTWLFDFSPSPPGRPLPPYLLPFYSFLACSHHKDRRALCWLLICDSRYLC